MKLHILITQEVHRYDIYKKCLAFSHGVIDRSASCGKEWKAFKGKYGRTLNFLSVTIRLVIDLIKIY